MASLTPIYIDSAIARGELSIGTLNSSTVNIGNANSSTNLAGNTISPLLKSTSIDSVKSGESLNIGTVIPSTINIGTQNATAINIGSESIFTTINGITNIARNTNATRATFLEGRSTATNAVLNFHSSGLFDNDYDSRIVATGGIATIGQGNLQLDAKSINITSPLTLQSSGFVIPTQFLQLGGTYSATSSITNILQNSAAVPTTMIFKQITTAGVYIINVYCQLTNTTGFTFFYTNIIESAELPVVNTASSGTALLSTGNFGHQLVGTVGGANYYASNGSIIVTVTSAKANYYYMFSAWIYTGGTLGSMNPRIDITRIA